MACRDTNTIVNNGPKLWFGVDSNFRSDTLLQNNLTLFEWATRNKVYPCFWGRHIMGDNCLTKEEIHFLRCKACKIVPIHNTGNIKMTEEQGITEAELITKRANELEIPEGVAIYLELEDHEDISIEYMHGYAKTLIANGYIPGFKANTDAKCDFDHEFSRAMQTYEDVIGKCLIWTVSPSLEEYDRVTTSHFVGPDDWKPFAPSGMKRGDIAIWQYGKDCHPINDDEDNEVVFNANNTIHKSIMAETMI